jgi:hypothetical protein
VAVADSKKMPPPLAPRLPRMIDLSANKNSCIKLFQLFLSSTDVWEAVYAEKAVLGQRDGVVA